jgi:hypothetical protein
MMTPPAASLPRRLSRRDLTVIACGALVLVASFLPWETATSNDVGVVYSGSASAWNAGFAAWFGSLLSAAAAAAAVARHLGHLQAVRGIGPNLAACALAVAGLVLLLLRLLTLPHSGSYGPLGTAGGYGYGPGFGAFAGVGLAAVQAIIALLNVRAAGEKFPSFASSAASASQPGPGGWQPPQAPGPGGWEVDAPVPGSPYQDGDLAQRLARLDGLRAKGLISDAEHAEQRRRIISRL